MKLEEQKALNLVPSMNILQRFKINKPKPSFLTAIKRAEHSLDRRFIKLQLQRKSASVIRLVSSGNSNPQQKRIFRPTRENLQKQINRCSDRITQLTSEINNVRRERRGLEEICSVYTSQIECKREKLRRLNQFQRRRKQAQRMQRIKSFEEEVQAVRFQKQYSKDVKIYRQFIQLDRPLQRPLQWPKIKSSVMITEQETFRKRVRNEEPYLASIKQLESQLADFQQLCSQNECESQQQVRQVYDQKMSVQQKLKNQINSMRQQILELKAVKQRLLYQKGRNQQVRTSNYESLRNQRLRSMQIEEFQLQDQLERQNKQLKEREVCWNKVVGILKEIQYALTNRNQTELAPTLLQIQDGLISLERHQSFQAKNKRLQVQHQSDLRLLEQRLRECRETKESCLMSRAQFERCFFDRKSKLKRR